MNYAELAGEYALYFQWLIDQVGGEEWWGDYGLALIRLFDKAYYFVNRVDSAAYENGRALRTEAIFDGIDPAVIPTDDTRVLEVLVSLAKDVDLHLMHNPAVGDRSPRWFEDMMNTLGFLDQSGEIDSEIDIFLAGKSQITKKRRTPAYSQSLWEQVNMFYLDQFDLETGEL